MLIPVRVIGLEWNWFECYWMSLTLTLTSISNLMNALWYKPSCQQTLTLLLLQEALFWPLISSFQLAMESSSSSTFCFQSFALEWSWWSDVLEFCYNKLIQSNIERERFWFWPWLWLWKKEQWGLNDERVRVLCYLRHPHTLHGSVSISYTQDFDLINLCPF